MADWIVTADGDSGNDGTLSSPWDLLSTLTNTTDVKAGDRVLIRGGIYRHPNRDSASNGYQITLDGSAAARIVIKPYRDERVIIDGGMYTNNASYIDIRDLEIIVAEWLYTDTPRRSTTDDLVPPDWPYPWGGIDVQTGTSIRCLNNVIHDGVIGFGLWSTVDGDSELYGNIIYSNGWRRATAGGTGHGMYSQNDAGQGYKYIRNNIIGGNYGYSCQIYGSAGAVYDNYWVEQNFVYNWQIDQIYNLGPTAFLLGGLNDDSMNGYRIFNNVFFRSNLQLGYSGNAGDDLIVRGNFIVMAKYEEDVPFTNRTVSHKLVWNEAYVGGYLRYLAAAPSIGTVPNQPLFWLFPNRFDLDRANFMVLTFNKEDSATIDVSDFLIRGDRWELRSSENFYGVPLASGVYDGNPLSIVVPQIHDNGTNGGGYVTGVLLRQKTDYQRAYNGRLINEQGRRQQSFNGALQA